MYGNEDANVKNDDNPFMKFKWIGQSEFLFSGRGYEGKISV